MSKLPKNYREYYNWHDEPTGKCHHCGCGVVAINGANKWCDACFLALARGETPKVEAERSEVVSAPHCHADSDGECTWDGCPQLRDGEPKKSGRHCPYDVEVVSTDNHFEMPKGLSFNVELSPEVAAQVSGVDGGARPDPAVADEILATAKRRLAALVGESSSILPMISRVEAAFKRFGATDGGARELEQLDLDAVMQRYEKARPIVSHYDMSMSLADIPKLVKALRLAMERKAGR
jgi:hypothetical protein